MFKVHYLHFINGNNNTAKQDNMTNELIRLYKVCRATGCTPWDALDKARIWTAFYPDTSFIELVN